MGREEHNRMIDANEATLNIRMIFRESSFQDFLYDIHNSTKGGKEFPKKMADTERKHHPAFHPISKDKYLESCYRGVGLIVMLADALH